MFLFLTNYVIVKKNKIVDGLISLSFMYSNISLAWKNVFFFKIIDIWYDVFLSDADNK